MNFFFVLKDNIEAYRYALVLFQQVLMRYTIVHQPSLITGLFTWDTTSNSKQKFLIKYWP